MTARALLGRLALFRARLAVAALAALAAWEITVLARAKADAPTDEEWRAAAAFVKDRMQPGDLVVFAPPWIDPIGRMWLGDRMTIDDAGRLDGVRYARVWEISIRGARAPEVAAEPRAVETGHFGPLTVRHFVRPAPRVTWDLRPASGLYEIDFTPKKCVLRALRHPGQTATIEAPDAVLGDELVVAAGLADFRSRRDNRARARVRVFVDGREVSSGVIDNDSGWTRLPVAATRAGPAVVRIELDVIRDGLGGSGPAPVKLDVCVAAEARAREVRP